MMRRRDATTSTVHCTRWRKVACLGLSLGFHVGLLAVAAVTVLRGSQTARLIRVSLASGGVSRGSEGARAEHAGASESGAAPHQPAPRTQPAAQEPGQQFANRPLLRARKHGPAPRREHPSAPLSTLPATANASTSGSDPAAVGRGLAKGSNVGTGEGFGNRSGTGGGDGVDQRVYCVYCPEPHYPLLARSRGWQGRVDVGLVVLADGSVDVASLRRSSGYGVLDEAAVAVARRSRFKPPSTSGLPAPLHGRIEYRFELTTAR